MTQDATVVVVAGLGPNAGVVSILTAHLRLMTGLGTGIGAEKRCDELRCAGQTVVGGTVQLCVGCPIALVQYT